MEENQLTKEVSALIEKLKERLSSGGLKKRFSAESFLAKDGYEVETSHEYLEEFSRFLRSGQEINLPSFPDMEPLYEAMERGLPLYPQDLSSIADLCALSAYLIDLFEDKPEYFHLHDDALDLEPLEGLRRDLINAIEPNLTISDRASSTLKEIRNQIRDLTRQLSNIMNAYKSRYASYLSEDVIAIKGGDEALPVKASCKGSVRGTVISYSSSGETAFMVPYEVIDLRNRLNSLKNDEENEVMKVLADLSQKCAKQLKPIQKDVTIIERFDRYLGSVRFGNVYQGVIAEIGDDELSLQGFFHPLLKAKKVICNTIELGGKQPKALLITGPNAGGKSVLIKAVALCVMMDKLGLLVPCQLGAKIPFVEEVHFLGGDNQSVLDNLSTFSSHLLGIKEITDRCEKKSLVIIDEVGEGTSPKDGEALGVALLKHFERIGCFTLLTSHFDGLKFYAASDKEALTAAMEFNSDSLTPTYRLLMNTTGKSYGLLLAKQMGLNPRIIEDAETFESERENQNTDALMEKLTEQVSLSEKRFRELEHEKKALDELIEKRRKAIIALNEERAQIHQKAQEKVERLVDQRLAEINRVWAEKGADGSLNYSEISKAKGELKKLKEDTNQGLPIQEKKSEMLKDLQPGELVEDEDGRRMKVLEVKKSEVTLDAEGLRFRRSLKGLRRSPLRPSDVKVRKPSVLTSADTAYLDLAPSQGMEINVIGLTRDEAMRKVVSFIDQARIHRYSMIRIIHGAGGFILKDAVWKYLSNHKEFVADYRFGGAGEGGLGATIVHLKV